MRTILTATNMRKLNIYLGDQENIKTLEEDIEYQEQLFSQLGRHDPEVLLISEALPGPFSKYELAEEIIKLNKKMKIIFLIKDNDDTTYIKFLKEKGIRDIFDVLNTDVNGELIPSILFEDRDKEEIKVLISDEVAMTEDPIESNGFQKIYLEKGVIAVASPGGGGVGKTTIAINLGVLAAKKYSTSKIVIVDGNNEKSDLARSLNIPEDKGLEWLIKATKVEDFNRNNILHSLEPYDVTLPNLYILPGVKTMMESDVYTLAHYRYLIDTLKNEFDLVIIDTGTFRGVSTHAAIEKATKVIFVVRDTENTIKSLKEKIDFYKRDLRYEQIEDKFEILMNMTIGYEKLNTDVVAEIFKKEPIANIRFNPEIGLSMERYKPFVDGNRKLKKETSSLEKALDKIFIYKTDEKKGIFTRFKETVVR